MVDKHLDHYREWFPEAHWKTIYSGGMISIPVSERHGSSYELSQMLSITAAMENLTDYPGFQELIAGFRNPTQIAATMFEVSVAGWCQARAVTQALEFSPHVTVRNHGKRPDILWDTTLGRLYCECKSSHVFQQAIAKRTERFRDVADLEYKRHVWPPSSRLDILLLGPALNGCEWRLKSVINTVSEKAASDSWEDVESEAGEVRATLRCRVNDPPDLPESLRTGLIEVGPVATRMAAENAYLTLTISVATHRQRAVAGLIQTAKTQLPDTETSMIFVESLGGPVVRRRLEELILAPSFVNIPCIALWENDVPHLTWRRGQPFDERLLAPRAVDVDQKVSVRALRPFMR